MGANHLDYRPDIDGFRAVAVILVLFFHMGWPNGGFIGVDIFFVISGYLIIGIINKQLNNNSFTLKRFYTRRAKRILPALFVTVISCFILLLLFAYPNELIEFSKLAIAATASVANLYLYATADYFAPASHEIILLHTWSLGVEEQFYLIYPLLMIVLFRYWPKRIFLILALTGLVSFVWSVWSTPTSPTAAFFLPHTRAWEFVLGGALVFIRLPQMHVRAVREAAAVGGALLVALSALTFSNDTSFPGYWALVPTLGATLIIAAGGAGRTLVGQVLAWEPVRFVGLLSYSLYLWHWPVIVFLEYYAPLPPLGRIEEAAMVLPLSFALAWLSWRFVERPFRTNGSIIPGRRLLPSWQPGLGTIGAMAATALLAAGVTLAFSGFPGRFDEQVVRMASYIRQTPETFRTDSCFVSGRATAGGEFDADVCLARSPDRPNVLLLGDSHAAHLWHGLSTVLAGAHVLQGNISACLPTVTHQSGGANKCIEFYNWIFREYLPNNPVDYVILSARWKQNNLEDLARTLSFLNDNNIKTILLGPITEYKKDLPRLVAASLQSGDKTLPNTWRRHEIGSLDAKVSALARRYGDRYGSTYAALCDASDCIVETDGAPVQFDPGHLTAEGSLLVARKLVEAGTFPEQLLGR